MDLGSSSIKIVTDDLEYFIRWDQHLLHKQTELVKPFYRYDCFSKLSGPDLHKAMREYGLEPGSMTSKEIGIRLAVMACAKRREGRLIVVAGCLHRLTGANHVCDQGFHLVLDGSDQFGLLSVIDGEQGVEMVPELLGRVHKTSSKMKDGESFKINQVRRISEDVLYLRTDSCFICVAKHINSSLLNYLKSGWDSVEGKKLCIGCYHKSKDTGKLQRYMRLV